MCAVLGRPRLLCPFKLGPACVPWLWDTAQPVSESRWTLQGVLCPVLGAGYKFCAGKSEENGGTLTAGPSVSCPGQSLYLPSQPATGLGSVHFLLRDNSRVHLSRVGGGIAIKERLIKAHCCHIPGRLSHLLNNIHPSFTQPPHILVAGRGPCDTGRTL